MKADHYIQVLKISIISSEGEQNDIVIIDLKNGLS